MFVAGKTSATDGEVVENTRKLIASRNLGSFLERWLRTSPWSRARDSPPQRSTRRDAVECVPLEPKRTLSRPALPHGSTSSLATCSLDTPLPESHGKVRCRKSDCSGMGVGAKPGAGTAGNNFDWSCPRKSPACSCTGNALQGPQLLSADICRQQGK